MTAMAMFPLGTVLVPTMVLPLHVFEPRYRVLAHDVTTGSRELGVVLIERGSEVGGGDVRTDVGCAATVVESHELPDGRWLLGCVGTRRIAVETWLVDDPYPRAEVRDWPDPSLAPGALVDERAAVVARLRRCLALQAELGLAGPPLDSVVEDDPATASFQVTALAPLGSLDRHRLLVAPDVEGRLALADELLTDAEQLLRARLAGPA